MGGENAPRTVEQGADTAIWLAAVDAVKDSGKLWARSLYCFFLIVAKRIQYQNRGIPEYSIIDPDLQTYYYIATGVNCTLEY